MEIIMIITQQDTGTSVLYTAKKGNFETSQLYAKAIPESKRDTHFSIESSILYEKWLDGAPTES